MIYRNYIPGDFEKVVEICKQHKIDVPLQSLVFVAVDDNDAIQGVAGIRHEVFLEPLISDNPIVAGKLYKETLQYLKDKGIKNIKIYCDKSKVKQFEKVGFTQFEPDLIFMQKEIEV